jgi:hypothetical protein
MAVPLSKYISIKDKYCIGYFGRDKSLILDLLKSRKAMEKQFPGLVVFIACKNEMMELIKGHHDIILESNIESFSGKVGYFRNLEEKSDLIRLLHESNITVDV